MLIATTFLTAVAAILQTSSRVRLRKEEIYANIRLNDPLTIREGEGLWHPQLDSITLKGKEYAISRGPLQSLLFWLEPAAGATAASILGTDFTLLFVGIILFAIGLWMLVIKAEVAIAFHQVLIGLEREHAMKLYLAGKHQGQ